jgi:PTS system N-acetylgalactosamine-specific IIA component
MIGLIVTGHGNFGTGLTSSLELIAGPQQSYKAVDFVQEFSVDDLARELTKAMDELSDCDGILVCSDIPGGSPFKTAVEIGFPRGNVNVVSGTNLAMLISAATLKGFMDLDTLTTMVMDEAKNSVVKYEFVKVVQQISDDGI